MRQSSRASILVLVTTATLLFAGCAPERVDEPYRSARTFTRYRHALTDLGVHQTPLGRAWILAGNQAMSVESVLELPFVDTLIFDPAEPSAAGFRFSTTRNRTISVRLTTDARPPLFFVDIYRLPSSSSDEPVKIASMNPQSDRITFKARRPASYLLRVMPEIGRGGRVTVEVDST